MTNEQLQETVNMMIHTSNSDIYVLKTLIQSFLEQYPEYRVNYCQNMQNGSMWVEVSGVLAKAGVING